MAELALRFEVELDGPPEVVAQLSALTERLASITGATRSVGIALAVAHGDPGTDWVGSAR